MNKLISSTFLYCATPPIKPVALQHMGEKKILANAEKGSLYMNNEALLYIALCPSLLYQQSNSALVPRKCQCH